MKIILTAISFVRYVYYISFQIGFDFNVFYAAALIFGF